jgi:hypothetical protein
MASKGNGPVRQHYEYARTGKVPGGTGGASLPAGMNHKHGGRVNKPRGRGK